MHVVAFFSFRSKRNICFLQRDLLSTGSVVLWWGMGELPSLRLQLALKPRPRLFTLRPAEAEEKR